MNAELSDEAIEYGRVVSHAIEGAGGDLLFPTAVSDPGGRDALVGPVLAELGAWELDPRGSDNDLEAAAALCRSAGAWALPYPVAERLARPTDLDADGLVVVADRAPAAALAGSAARWVAVTLDGRRSLARIVPGSVPPRRSAFVTELVLEAIDGDGDTDIALGLVLPCWTLLGMLDRALSLTCAYVRDRTQFGQPLASFQGVQFQLTDAEVERSGVEELARYALWSVATHSDDAIEDALALRLAAIEASEVVFRVAHQLHGAIGFCDETMVSWLSRASQPLRRLPFGASATRDELTRRLGRHGLTGLFNGPDVWASVEEQS